MELHEISAEQLRTRLNKGIVDFAFKKINENIRTARGTRNIADIPLKDHPSTGKSDSDAMIPFYDLDKKEWRAISARSEMFIKI
jgi:hypothetical protein